MKLFLVLCQLLYALCIVPWLLVWGLSFMSFDQGFSWAAAAFVTGIGLYPIAAIVCSIIAWKLYKHRKGVAVFINLIPMFWTLGLGIPLLMINLS